jgi:hypothetical protein
MQKNKRKEYCLIDHANKQKELARFSPYEFWTNQVKRRPCQKAKAEDQQPARSD